LFFGINISQNKSIRIKYDIQSVFEENKQRKENIVQVDENLTQQTDGT
jgi:hypothetical protein